MITAPSVEENTKDPSAPEQEVVPEEDMLSLPEEKLTLTAAPSSLLQEPITPMESSRTGEFVLSELAGSSDYDNLQTNKDLTEMERRSTALNAAAYSDRRMPADFTSIIKEIADAPMPKKTNGEAIVDKVLTQTTTKVKEETATGLDFSDKSNTLHEDIKKNIGVEGSLNEYLSLPQPAAYETASAIARKTGREVDFAMFEEDGFSIKNMFEFINPLGGEDKKGMDMELWQTTKDIVSDALPNFSNDSFKYADFDKRMESNYGNDWEARWAGFLVKEAGIDAGLIALAATGVGAPLAAIIKGTQLGYKARLASIASRTAIIGVGGGAVQSATNVLALDRDANFGNEVVGRALGQGIMEGIGWGAQAGIKSIANKSTAREASEAVATNLNTKTISESTLSDSIKAANEGPVSVLASLTRARIHANIKQYDSIIQDTASKITGRNFTKEEVRDTLISDLSMLTGKDITELETIEFDLLLPLMRDNIEDVILKNATRQGNDDVVNARELINDMFATISGKSEANDDVWRLYLNSKGPDFRTSDAGVAIPKDNMLNDFMKLGRVVEMSAIVGRDLPNYQSATRFGDNVNRGYQTWVKSINKGLSKEEQRVVSETLSRGGADGVVYDFDSILPEGLSGVNSKVKKAYVETRMLLDSVHTMTDQALLRLTKDKVYVKDGVLVEVSSKGSKTSSKWEYRDFDSEALAPTGPSKSGGAELFTPPTTILPYKIGFVPRMYNKHRFSFLVLNKEKGTLSREAMFNTRQEMAAHKEARVKTNEDVIEVDHNGSSGLSAMRGNANSVNVLKSIPDENVAGMTKILEEAGLTPDQVAVIFKGRSLDNISPSSRARTELGVATTEKGYKLRRDLANLHAGMNAKQARVKTAKSAAAKAHAKKGVDADNKSILDIHTSIKEELINSAMPTSQAIKEYLDVSTKEAGMGNFRRVAIEHFDNKYKQHLDFASGSTWHNIKYKTNTPQHIQSDIQRHADWMTKVIHGSTRHEDMLDGALSSVGSRLNESAVAGHISAKALLAVLDILPNSRGIFNIGRFTDAFTKLLTFNMPHLLIQSFQAVNAIGATVAKDPMAATRAVKRVVDVISIHNKTIMGRPISEAIRKSESYAAYRLLKESGYTADLDVADIAFNIKTDVNPSVGNTLFYKARNASNKLRAGAAAVAKVGGIPFRLGEGGNRIMSFVAVREQMVAALKHKKYDNSIIGLDGNPLTKADIDSPAFADTVIEKAKILALDMGKTGELEAFSGVGSLLLQFKQVGFKTVSMYNSTVLSPREKIGAAIASFTTFGMGGVPFAVDLLNSIDLIGFYATGEKPTTRTLASDFLAISLAGVSSDIDRLSGGTISEDGFKRMVSKGSINAMTEGEVNLLTRASMGNFWGDTLDVNSFAESVVFFAVAGDIIDMEETILGLGGTRANVVAVYDIYTAMSNGKTFQEAYAAHYTPNSTIAKFILSNEVTGATLALEALRATGKVFSSAGGASRALDARYKKYTNPDAHLKYGATPVDNYRTSGLTDTGVERTWARSFSYWLGIAPGAVIDRAAHDSKERMVKDAQKNFTMAYKDDMLNMVGAHARYKRRREWVDEMHELSSYARAWGLKKLEIPPDPWTTSKTIISNINDKFNTGETK